LSWLARREVAFIATTLINIDVTGGRDIETLMRYLASSMRHSP